MVSFLYLDDLACLARPTQLETIYANRPCQAESVFQREVQVIRASYFRTHQDHLLILPPLILPIVEQLANGCPDGEANRGRILEASGKISAVAAFRVARQHLGGMLQSRDDLMMPLYDVLSAMELLVPASMQDAFIPPGDTWDGYSALVKLIQRECDDILIVDPYLSSDVYLYFAPHSVATKGVRCLCQKMNQTFAGLQASAAKWASDPISKQHPVEVRFAAEKSLHDRLVIIDGQESWIITQSIKDIAKRSPASVTRAEPELARMKSDYYEKLWANATPLA